MCHFLYLADYASAVGLYRHALLVYALSMLSIAVLFFEFALTLTHDEHALCILLNGERVDVLLYDTHALVLVQRERRQLCRNACDRR